MVPDVRRKHARVRVVTEGVGSGRVYVDDREVHGVRSVGFSGGVGEVSVVTLSIEVDSFELDGPVGVLEISTVEAQPELPGLVVSGEPIEESPFAGLWVRRADGTVGPLTGIVVHPEQSPFEAIQQYCTENGVTVFSDEWSARNSA